MRRASDKGTRPARSEPAHGTTWAGRCWPPEVPSLTASPRCHRQLPVSEAPRAPVAAKRRVDEASLNFRRGPRREGA